MTIDCTLKNDHILLLPNPDISIKSYILSGIENFDFGV